MDPVRKCLLKQYSAQKAALDVIVEAEEGSIYAIDTAALGHIVYGIGSVIVSSLGGGELHTIVDGVVRPPCDEEETDG